MTYLNLFTQAELESKKLADITDHYNSISKLIGLKAVKKFRDKTTAVSRTLGAQETYAEENNYFTNVPDPVDMWPDENEVKPEEDIKVKVLPPEKDHKWGRLACSKSAYKAEKATKAKKPASSSTSKGVRQNKLGITDDSVIEVVKGTPKAGSIEDSLFNAINNEMCSTVKEIVAYIVANHVRPRSGEPVDAAYALHNIKWFVKKGHLKVV